MAHPDNTYLETLVNYKNLTRTVSVRDTEGNAMLDAEGNIAVAEESFSVSGDFKAVIDAVMGGKSGLEVIAENGATYYMSYMPIDLPGYSDSWAIITLQDRAVAMGVVSRLTVSILIIVFVIIVIFILCIFGFYKSLNKTMGSLENARYEAEEANKSKSNFLATMSHEIRTPLNAVIGIAQIELQKLNLSDEYASSFDKIYTSGSSLLGIINDILDMSKIETGKLELNPAEYDLPSLINDAVQLNIVRIGSKPVEFILEADENLPSRFIGDELRLKQILNNLLSNAIKYTQKGHVKLSVSHTEEDGYIMLCFSIEDTGQGMKLEDREKFFSEYQRFNMEANRTTEGTGLGLSITKKLVEMMDGMILVESEYGKGTKFTIMIKQETVDCDVIGTELAQQLRNFTFQSEGFTSHTTHDQMEYGKVLVVDDVDINLYVAEGMMSQYGLNVETVLSGFEAIDLINSGKTYDVIFMDHMMPQMDGIETTQKLRESGYTGCIVALTANALVGNSDMFLNNGFDGFISKPIDITQLDNILNEFVRDKHPDEK